MRISQGLKMSLRMYEERGDERCSMKKKKMLGNWQRAVIAVYINCGARDRCIGMGVYTGSEKCGLRMVVGWMRSEGRGC